MKRRAAIIPTLTAAAGQARAQPVPLSNAFLTFNLYDQSGTVIGYTMAHVQNLAAGDHWQFAAQTPLAFARAQVSQTQVFPPAAPSR